MHGRRSWHWSIETTISDLDTGFSEKVSDLEHAAYSQNLVPIHPFLQMLWKLLLYYFLENEISINILGLKFRFRIYIHCYRLQKGKYLKIKDFHVKMPFCSMWQWNYSKNIQMQMGINVVYHMKNRKIRYFLNTFGD